MATELQNEIYQVSEAPNISEKESIIMQSLDDLKRFCFDFNRPLLYILHGKVVYGSIPLNSETTYSIYFTKMDGVYFVFYKKEGIKTKPTVVFS